MIFPFFCRSLKVPGREKMNYLYLLVSRCLLNNMVLITGLHPEVNEKREHQY